MTQSTDSQTITPVAADLAAERLLSTIDSACEPSADFPAQLDAALSAALDLFATEPGLIRPLTDRRASEAVLTRQREFRATCIVRLREAAQRGTASEEHSPFVESFLIAAIQYQVSRTLREGETDLLPDRTAELRDFILAYYRQAI